MAKGNTAKDVGGEKTQLQAPCFYCKHLIAVGVQFDNERWTCKAFPKGIPYGIWARHTPHDEVVEGIQQGKYVFESKVYDNGEGYMEKITFKGDWVKAE